MVRVAKSWVQMLMKLVNWIIGMAAIAMVLYSMWMIRVWQRDAEGSSFDDHSSTIPWFIHGFLAIGITLCAITCFGHVAADTANSHCLSCYMVIILLFLILETAMIANIFLNSEWEKELPEDPTGRFDDFKDFVKSNTDICQWVGMLIILSQLEKYFRGHMEELKLLSIQGFSILFATIIQTLARDAWANYNSDDDYEPPRLPLLNPHIQPLPCIMGEQCFVSKNTPW